LTGATAGPLVAEVEHDRRQGALDAVLLFVLVRVAGLVALAWGAERDGVRLGELLTKWDGRWYAGIAENGYGIVREHPDGRLLSDYAFYPMLPFLERLLHATAGVDPARAGVLVSLVAAPLAAWGVYRVVEGVTDRRTACTVVVMWACLPVSAVQSLAYTESLFTALAAWALHGAHRERWAVASGLAVAAALTRPTGVAVTAAVVCAAAAAWWAGRRRGAAVFTVVACLAGTVAYPSWVAWRLGSPWAYFEVTAGWGNSFDGGVGFAGWVGALLTQASSLAAGLAVLAGLCGLGALLWAVRRDPRIPAHLLVYAVVLVVLAVGMSGYFGSKPRYLLPAFVLLVPVAGLLTRAGTTRRTVLVLALAAVASTVYGSVWLLGSGPP
jgi:hypothetical protein